MRRFGKYLKPYIGSVILGPILMLVEVVGEIVLPYLMALIINEGIQRSQSPSYVITIGVIMLVMVLLMMSGGIGGAYFAVKTSTGFGASLRQDLFEKVQKFSFANIDKYSTGSLITRLTNDITQIQNMITAAMRMVLRSVGMFVGAIIMAFAMNSDLAMTVVCILPVILFIAFIVLKVGFPRFNLMQKKIDKLNSTVQESVTNVRVVKSFVREDFERERFGEANQDLKDSTMRALSVVIMSMPLMMLAMNLTTILVVWFGGQQIVAGEMEVGNLSSFTTYIVQILSSLMMISMMLFNGSRALASIKRISEVLEEKVDLNDIYASEKDRLVTEGRISFENVFFQYYKGTEEWVLENINFTVEPGETVGIIGSTGSGKSSLVQLIPRLYDPDQGRILVDGVDVKEYSLKHLRDGVGMVLQKNVLFSGTIEDNLKWGDEWASEEEIQGAAESAQAHGFIEGFVDGYQTELGQGGVNVSGGQKQRLCIARALLKKPKILILDDSTSAVDTATESRIREAFATTLKDTTKIIIAQRIGSVMEADKILVMDDGKIVAEGNHEELLKTSKTYQEIYYSQKDKEENAS